MRKWIKNIIQQALNEYMSDRLCTTRAMRDPTEHDNLSRIPIGCQWENEHTGKIFVLKGQWIQKENTVGKCWHCGAAQKEKV